MHLRDGLVAHPSVAQRYRHLAESGAIESDAAQLEIAAALDRLIEAVASKRLATKSSSLGWLFARKRPQGPGVRCLYIHGGVGRGKTMLMDMFFELVPCRRKRRVHFNDFMADAQDRIQRHRKARSEGTVREDDPIPPVARALAEEAWVLCFDEFTVTDIADAMILSRLFSALFAEGVVLVATSNVAPDDLYRDGLNRPLFLPFVDILKRHADVMSLEARKDYRQDRLSRMPVYVSPLGADADRMMDEAWRGVTHGRAARAESIAVMGRAVEVPRSAGDAARFDFADLCGNPLGARDYAAIAARYDTIFVDRVPVMGDASRNEAKRFILLIDTLYDKRLRLFASAETSPESLYAGRVGTEAFEFARTASRLEEMQSRDWLDAWREAQRQAPAAAAS